MPKTKAVKAPTQASAIYVHEVNQGGQHRIVRILNGQSNAGLWTSYQGVAQHGSVRATTAYWEGVLPQGCFKFSPVAHVPMAV